jgi:hypothetical protein
MENPMAAPAKRMKMMRRRRARGLRELRLVVADSRSPAVRRRSRSPASIWMASATR